MDLLYFLKVLFRRKWIIIGLSMLAVIATFILLLYKKPLFESLAQYSTGFTAEKVRLADGTTAIDLYTADVKFNNAIETFKSPKVISMISYKLLLHDLEDPTKAYRTLTANQMESPVYKAIKTEDVKRILTEKVNRNELLRSDNAMEKVILEYLKLYRYDYEEMLRFVSIERVERTDYLNITYRSENANLSSLVVNSMGEEFLNYYKNLSSIRSEENAQSIKELVSTQQNKVDSLGRRLLSEKMTQGSIDPVSRNTSAMETVKELETKLAEERSKYNEHLNRVTYLKARLQTLQSGASGSNNNDEVIRLTNKKNDLVAELARKGGNDPALQQQINDLRAEIILKSNSGSSKIKVKEEIDNITRQLNEEDALLNAAASTIADYSSRIRKYMSMTNVNPGSDVKMDAIRTQLDMENKQLGSVKEKYTLAVGLIKDDPTANFIQTRIGQPAVDPESKKTLLKMILAGISMFFLTAIFFIFLEIFDSSVKTPAIFAKQSPVKISGVLNDISLKKQTASALVLSDHGGKKFAESTVFKNNIRKLRYELFRSGKRVFLFTSTQKGAGKSAVLESLAASLVLSNKKVLLIDFNFSNNSLTRRFNADKFIQDFNGKIKYDLPLNAQAICSTTELDNLYIIGCREENVTPTEAIYDLDLALFLQKLQAEYDYILIEGAALNLYADSKELAKYADGIFTVYAATTAVTQLDNESFAFLESQGDKNYGIVLNKVFKDNLDT
jgi:polysaccharide biosynthesis transport protein